MLLYASAHPLLFAKSQNIDWLEEYDIVWRSQSNNSNESMPCGGGDIGMNVWVEDGDILFYMERSGNLDERDQMLKSGRFRIEMTPNPFAVNKEDVAIEFSQRLDLESGAVIIDGKSKENDVNIKLWAEVYRPMVHVEIESSVDSRITATYESWRTKNELIPQSTGRDFNRWASYGYCTYAGDVIAYADSIKYVEEKGVLFYHQNCDDLLFDKEVKLQRLDNVIDQMRHPTKDRIFGGYMYGTDMVVGGKTRGVYASTPFKGWSIVSQQPHKEHYIEIVLHTEQTTALDQWRKNLSKRVDERIKIDKLWTKNLKWWNEFWNRSYILINRGRGKDNIGWQVGRNYQLMRYILACNYYGEFPTRFNGGLFTIDPIYLDTEDYEVSPSFFNPDFRKWGAWTGMNQRLIYWPMLRTGDFEAMRPQFNFYRDNYINGYLRNKESFGIEACSYAEQCNSGALPNGYHYGWEPPYGTRSIDSEKGMERSMHKTYYQTQLEFVFMMYQWYKFSGNDLTEYIPFMRGSMDFMFEFFMMLQRRRDGNSWGADGKLVLTDMNSTETYKPGSNPLPDVVALHTDIKALLSLPEKWIDYDYKKKLRDWAKRVPEINYRMRNGKKTYSPLLEKEVSERVGNRELPQLYPVFPYGICALGLPNVEVGRDTWKYGLDSVSGNYLAELYGEMSYPQRVCWWGWGQQAVMTARLGLTDDAEYYISKKLSDAQGTPMSENPYKPRFPAFWGEGYGCKPSMEWGAVGMVGLQEMMLQTITNDGRDIRIFPSCPEHWDVEFKLYAPNRTVVESSYKNGKVNKTIVFPSYRNRDIIYP